MTPATVRGNILKLSIFKTYSLTTCFMIAAHSSSSAFAADKKDPLGNCTVQLGPSYKPTPRGDGQRWEVTTQKVADLLPSDFSEMEELVALALINNEPMAIQPLVDLCYQLNNSPRLPFLLILTARKVNGMRLVRFFEAFQSDLTLGQKLLMTNDPKTMAMLDGTAL